MNRFEPVIKKRLTEYENCDEVVLPLRGSKTSAGYDFFATKDLVIKPQQKVKFFTDVKVFLEPNKFLLGVVRSSKGVKDDLMLCNTIGVIDSDYYGNEDNDGNIGFFIRNLRPALEIEGHIFANVLAYTKSEGDTLNCVNPFEEYVEPTNQVIPIPIISDLTKDNTIKIKKGERVVQGIIITHDVSANCNTEEQRKGGYGSTGK